MASNKRASETPDDGDKRVKKRKIDRRLPFTHFHSNHTIDTFLTFRRHVASINRFNLYIHNLKNQYEKNNYFRIMDKHAYDLFLPSPQDPNWHWLLRVVYESINNQNILLEDSKVVTLNVTSVYEDHLKRIIDKNDPNIHTWFGDVKRDLSKVPKRILRTGLTPTARNLRTSVFAPNYLKQIKQES